VGGGGGIRPGGAPNVPWVRKIGVGAAAPVGAGAVGGV
jgi:hypothetical protein